MADFSFEVVRSAAVEEVVELYKAGGWWQEQPAWRDAIPGMIRGSFCFMVIRDADGRAVGMGRAISDGASDAYIQDIVVVPALRGRGLGKELVRRLVDYCRERGIDWVGLIAEPGTERMYEALGFRTLEGHRPMRHFGPDRDAAGRG
ncbi:MAG: GNAT family N-acetyltransferase [Acidobacteria bacterium]|nr:GNAT family N-acetyltransferase [Acidobacteriota bacterium]